ncbi:LysR substrate-binding domain-containing protein [Beijerinckia sp. L45]|uniref:LysR family transcriptional regulator n=1 Tax=Beijerinckia sp. L45 TaxID=1641855 RepID=UPI00131E509C|nr:LysR substrate-binding domain-containing protein [Beijerinckia sp. L45]
MRHLELDDLNLFRHIAEAGSITAGAARANLALAAASTRVKGMETRLGAVLFTRSRQGVTATAAGHALLVHARTLLSQADRMHEDLGSYAGGAAGHVRMLSNTNALVEFLPEVLGRFLAAYPGTTVDLQERVSDEIVGLVAEGAADLGIVAGTVDTGTLETCAFREDRFVLVVAPGHALATRSEIAFADVLDQDIVGLDWGSALTRFLAARAAREGRRLTLRVQLRGFDGVCRLVEAAVGIGIVPQTTARRAAKTMAIVQVPLTDIWARRDLRICLRSRAALSLSAGRLLEALEQTEC